MQASLIALAVASVCSVGASPLNTLLDSTYEQGQVESLALNFKLREGDILDSKISTRNVIKDLDTLWPNKTIPYQISEDFGAEEREQIVADMKMIENGSCVRFKESQAANGNDLLYVTKNFSECFSPVGRQGGVQFLNLQGSSCGSGRVAHELMHALGFQHLHNAPNRDKYIRVNLKNVNEEHKESFEKYDSGHYTDYGLPYDYASIMHYGRKIFSSNGEDTITPLGDEEIGQADRLSEIDFKKLNLRYSCDGEDENSSTPAGGHTSSLFFGIIPLPGNRFPFLG